MPINERVERDTVGSDALVNDSHEEKRTGASLEPTVVMVITKIRRMTNNESNLIRRSDSKP